MQSPCRMGECEITFVLFADWRRFPSQLHKLLVSKDVIFICMSDGGFDYTISRGKNAGFVKGHFGEHALVLLVPSLRLLYPRSGFWCPGTSAKTTLSQTTLLRTPEKTWELLGKACRLIKSKTFRQKIGPQVLVPSSLERQMFPNCNILNIHDIVLCTSAQRMHWTR